MPLAMLPDNLLLPMFPGRLSPLESSQVEQNTLAIASSATPSTLSQVGRGRDDTRTGTAKGINARSATLQMSQIARAIEGGMSWVYRMVDNDTDKILGATLVGYEAAEIVHAFR